MLNTQQHISGTHFSPDLGENLVLLPQRAPIALDSLMGRPFKLLVFDAAVQISIVPFFSSPPFEDPLATCGYRRTES